MEVFQKSVICDQTFEIFGQLFLAGVDRVFRIVDKAFDVFAQSMLIRHDKNKDKSDEQTDEKQVLHCFGIG